MSELLIRQGELVSSRVASRNLYHVLEQLARGDVEKYVLVDQKKNLRGVLLSVDTYAALLAVKASA